MLIADENTWSAGGWAAQSELQKADMKLKNICSQQTLSQDLL